MADIKPDDRSATDLANEMYRKGFGVEPYGIKPNKLTIPLFVKADEEKRKLRRKAEKEAQEGDLAVDLETKK